MAPRIRTAVQTWFSGHILKSQDSVTGTGTREDPVPAQGGPGASGGTDALCFRGAASRGRGTRSCGVTAPLSWESARLTLAPRIPNTSVWEEAAEEPRFCP
ncbi:hypothetical protein HPG69_009585 [Diceros bicornis minor]|uniref:Uncharacterized protein n=1 Tax=Diceros bicornis minor TaxID=77932 RepID=A0A7J7EX16_DICBM|nr:hypothetical protein HPG69_009585 [Diceros bicornis minor]